MRHVGKAEALALVELAAGDVDPRHRGCVMCALAGDAGSPERPIVARTDLAVAVIERFAIRRGHLVIVLRRHAERIADLSWTEYSSVQRLAWEAARALESALSPVRIFIASLGAPTAIATSFPHHHVHVIPLYDGGPADRPAEVLTWEKGVSLYEEGEARSTGDAIRAAWPEG